MSQTKGANRENQDKFLASQDGWTKFLTQSSLTSVYFCIFIILEYWKIENSHSYWATNSILSSLIENPNFGPFFNRAKFKNMARFWGGGG